ncbi:MAG: GNAT family N-acetyltransferase, partial [Anaerolineales bacterium]|nr:GNAT family N-acetyltransferase [Anaerolineales bacterium]
IKPHRDGSLEMASVVVEEDLRGEGLGRLLIERLIDGIHQPLWLMCRSSLIPLYEKFGFEEVDADAEQPAYFRRVRRLASVYHFLKGTGEYLAIMCRPVRTPQHSDVRKD